MYAWTNDLRYSIQVINTKKKYDGVGLFEGKFFSFSMGPIGSPLSKIGVQVTDSSYVLLSMRIMTRVSSEIWKHLRADEEFVKCLHSFGKKWK